MEQAQVPDTTDATDPLMRMARRGQAQAAQQQQALRMALSQAFGRMCAGCPGLDGGVTRVARRHMSLAELVEMTEPGTFLALLQAPDDGMGMAWLCPGLLAALVEAQTTGQVLAMPPGDAPPRLPTRTDAALIAPMIDNFLHQVSERCAELPEAGLLGGYAYGSFLEDSRPMGVVLEDVEYELFSMQVALAQGAVTGTWTLVVPRPQADKPCADKDDAAEWEDRLNDTVSRSAVALNAVLCRLKLTLNEALALQKGDILRVPESALETLGLSALGGAQVASGRLGQARGFRAVRLIADPHVAAPQEAHSVPTLRFSKVAAAPPANGDHAARSQDDMGVHVPAQQAAKG